MKTNRLNTILVIIITILSIISISCQNTLFQDSGNTNDLTTSTTLTPNGKGSLRIYIEENIKTRTIITDASAIVFDLYSIELTSDFFADRTADFTSNVAVFNNIEAGSWNIAVKGKRSGLVIASGYLAGQTITAETTTDANVTIKLNQSATGSVKIRISFPASTGITALSAQLEGYAPVDLTVETSTDDAAYKTVLFDKSAVSSGMKDLIMIFKNASGTVLGMYREAVNIFDNLTSDKWIDGGVLKSVLLYSATDFADTNANFLDLTTDSGRAFDASFTSLDYAYSMKVANFQDKIKITPTLSIQGQSIRYQLNGGGYNYPASGIISENLALNIGDNTIDIEVTAQDYATQKFYQIIVKRLPKPTAPVISITGTSYGERYTFNPGNNIYYDLTTDYSNRIYHHWTKTSSSTPSDPPDPILPDPTTAHNLYYPPAFDEGSRYIWEAPGQTIKWIIKAIAYNEFDETSDVSTYRITLDNFKPSGPVLNPVDGSTDVSGNTNLVMTFWETIQKGTGNIYIKRYSDDATIDTINVTSPQVTIADKVLTVNPTIDLTEDGTQYYINIDSTAILDVVGNAYNGINVTNFWGFATKDLAAPTILSSSLDSSNSFIDLTFSEGVYTDPAHNPVEKTDFNIIFSKNGGGATGASISSVTKFDNSALTGGEAQIRVNLTITGTPTGVETIEIKPATASSIYDYSGNALSSSQSSGQKTTNDTTAPAAEFLTLPPLLTNLAWANITVGGTDVVSYKYKLDGGAYWGETAVGTPIGLAGLSDATHTVYVIGKDAAGNWQAVADATTYTWTIDTTAPTALSYSPSDESTNVLVNANLVLNFSENVTAVAGKTIKLFKTVGNVLSQTISADSATYVSGSGTGTITINPPDLAFGTGYYIQIDAGAFKDSAGNSYAGIADNTTWNFTTKPAGNINVTINITSPTSYTVTFNPNVMDINKNLGESLFVSAILSGATAYQWYLDGTAYATTSSISVSSLAPECYLGVHNLAVIVTKDSQPYSAQTNFSVVSY